MLSRLFPKPNPLAVTHGVLDTLVKDATDRRDMRTIHRLEEARKAIVNAALAGGKRS